MSKCEQCQREVDRLDLFPGGICLECYKQSPAGRRIVTADELVQMWGGVARP